MKVLMIGTRPAFQGRLRKLLNGLGGGLAFFEAPDFGEAIALGAGGDMVGLICIDLDSVRHRALSDLSRLQAAYPGVPVAMFDSSAVHAGSNALVACHALDEAMPAEEQRAALQALGEMLGIRTGAPAEAAICTDARLKRLTEREREVLHHLMSGLSNKAIARLLDLQEVTVKAHLRQVFRKLGVTNRTQATALALSIYGTPSVAERPAAAAEPPRPARPRPLLPAGLAHAA